MTLRPGTARLGAMKVFWWTTTMSFWRSSREKARINKRHILSPTVSGKPVKEPDYAKHRRADSGPLPPGADARPGIGRAASADSSSGPMACGDVAAQKAWLDSHWGEKASEPFFSLAYGGKPLTSAVVSWRRTREMRSLDQHRQQLILTWTDPATGLVVRCEGVEYRDFPAVEWVLHLKNEGHSPTRILSDILPLATLLVQPATRSCTLHYAKGGVAGLDDFAPQHRSLKPGGRFELRSSGGRSSNGVLPFFNVDLEGGGLIGAIGWTGTVSAGKALLDEGLLVRFAVKPAAAVIRYQRLERTAQ